MLTSHGDYPATTVPGLETNTLWDGIFHGATWLTTVVGLGMLWRLERTNDVSWSPALLGALLMGWDLASLTWGAVFLAGGYALVRRRRSPSSEDNATRRPMGFPGLGSR
jgi:uncharacterized membrane protein